MTPASDNLNPEIEGVVDQDAKLRDHVSWLANS